MKKQLLFGLLFGIASLSHAQERFPKNQISVNVFRNPSIGFEYHRKQVSVHGGYYLTNFESNVTTQFVKAGASYWFLPWGRHEVPSSLYVGSSYLRGINRDYKNKNAMAFEVGARFTIWKGLNFRFGVIGLTAQGESPKLNPTPSFSYTIKL